MERRDINMKLKHKSILVSGLAILGISLLTAGCSQQPPAPDYPDTVSPKKGNASSEAGSQKGQQKQP
jgi:hypothetical protein